MPSARTLVFRALARADVEAAAQWFTDEAGERVAERFAAELEAVYARIASNPDLASPRWGIAMGIPGMRHWRLNRFPYLVFFIARTERIEIVRVLHAARDIPGTLAGAEERK